MVDKKEESIQAETPTEENTKPDKPVIEENASSVVVDDLEGGIKESLGKMPEGSSETAAHIQKGFEDANAPEGGNGEIEKKKRGRKPGQKNKPKQESTLGGQTVKKDNVVIDEKRIAACKASALVSTSMFLTGLNVVGLKINPTTDSKDKAVAEELNRNMENAFVYNNFGDLTPNWALAVGLIGCVYYAATKEDNKPKVKSWFDKIKLWKEAKRIAKAEKEAAKAKGGK